MGAVSTVAKNTLIMIVSHVPIVGAMQEAVVEAFWRAARVAAATVSLSWLIKFII